MDKSGGRKVMDEIRSFEKASLFDLGHPLLNRIADSFVKAAGVSFIIFHLCVNIYRYKMAYLY